MSNEQIVKNKGPSVPIRCVFEANKGLFRVTETRGKALPTGGFGIVLSERKTEDSIADESSADQAEPVRQATVSHEYLFVEEVIYLFERGLLQVDKPNGDTLQSYDIYNLLEPCGVSLAAHLVYAHLRSQNYRVLRHSPERQLFIEQLDREQARLLETQAETGTPATEIPTTETSETLTAPSETMKDISDESDVKNCFSINKLIRKLREASAKATPPKVDGSAIGFDVYNPNAAFSRRAPGPPDVHVAISCGDLNFLAIQKLLRDLQNLATQKSKQTPLRIATVSDGGTVILFGVTDAQVPVYHGDHAQAMAR